MRKLIILTILLTSGPALAQSDPVLQNEMSQRVQTMVGNLAIANSNLQTQIQYDQTQIATLNKQIADLKKQLADPKPKAKHK